MLSINISEKDFELVIVLDFLLMHGLKGGQLRLELTGIEEYCFYYGRERIFYNVEDYKLLAMDKGYCLVLDPDRSSDDFTEQDQDFIRFLSCKGWLLNPG